MPEQDGEKREYQSDNFQRLQTLIINVLERLSVLETSAKFADQQRANLIQATGRLNERLEPFSTLVNKVEQIERDVRQMKILVDEHEGMFGQGRGAARVGRGIWALIYLIFGGAGGAVVMKWLMG